jgi:hypothetical protein
LAGSLAVSDAAFLRRESGDLSGSRSDADLCHILICTHSYFHAPFNETFEDCQGQALRNNLQVFQRAVSE